MPTKIQLYPLLLLIGGFSATHATAQTSQSGTPSSGYIERFDVVTKTPTGSVTRSGAPLPEREVVTLEAYERKEYGSLITEGIPTIPYSVKQRIKQYQNVRVAALADWLGNDTMIIRTRFGETNQLHKVEKPLGARTQLTYFDEPVRSGKARPGGEEILFYKDRGGDENFQIHIFDEATGYDTVYTEPGTRNGEAVWSRDGLKIAWFQSRGKDPNWDIVIADFGNPESRRTLVEGEGAYYPLDFSPDGSRLIVSRYVSASEGYLYEVDLASGTLSPINDRLDKVSYLGAVYAPDGRSVYYASDENSGYLRLWRYTLASGEKVQMTPHLRWDVENYDLSPNGQYLAYSANEGGQSKLRIIETRRNREISNPDLDPGLISGLKFSPDSKKIAFTFEAANAPDNIYAYEIDSRQLVQWTQGETGGLDTDRFVKPRSFTYKSFDDLDIPAWLFKPDTPGPHPVIIYIHGGPESQYRPRFSSTFQYWANELGLAIIAPNVRGSSGYGANYVSLDNGMKREDSVKDIGALIDWIGKRRDLDSDKVVVYGGSYGGYMVLASLTKYSDRLAGGVDIVGISNFVTFLENTKGYRRDLRRQEYGDERIPEMRNFLNSISPSNQATKIRAPLFVIQGYNDPRVPASEATQILRAVRANGRKAWYLLALDEGHGFRKKSNQDFRLQAETMFLKETLNLD